MVTFRSDVRPPLESIIALYCAAPLYRPVDDLDRMRRMYAGSNIVLTAWAGDALVGVLRGITDGAYTTYVCDLAVHPDHQHSGIGRALLDQVVSTYPETGVVLQAAPIAANYYHHIGWEKVENGWQRPRARWTLSARYAPRDTPLTCAPPTTSGA
jgi:GNAT superfamily N-acetyltransferase